jgi:heat-inducible transcriptional repressor
MKKYNADSSPSLRAKLILSTIVDKYVQDGIPVGSKSLSLTDSIDLSPATIRHVMSDLEELGFIASPHTSSGRIPTPKGYRFFIDSLLKLKPVEQNEIRNIKARMQTTKNSGRELAKNVSNTLSAITKLAGIVTIPKQSVTRLKEIDFIPLSDKKILAIIVTNEAEVENRILEMNRIYSREELNRAANYLNTNFKGRGLVYIKKQLIRELQTTKESVTAMMTDLINITDQVLDTKTSEEYIVAGQRRLMDFQELSDVTELRKLFDAFREKHELLALLDKSMSTSGIQIFIGEESGYQMFDNCTVITSPYTTEDGAIGVLGVIGPTRISYQKIIPIVGVTAKLLNQPLNLEN